MKAIRTLLFLACIIVPYTMIHAHNPLSASFFLESKENFGILNISVSQTGLHEVIKKKFSEKDVEKLSIDEYKKIVVQYLKENFSLTIDNNNISLLDGGIKLGNHQTDIKFITSELPFQFENILVKIDAFRENNDHQTIFSISLNGYKDKVILGQNNEYVGSFNMSDKIVSKATMTPVGSAIDIDKKINYAWLLLLLPFSIFLIFKVFNLKKSN